jgi:hypothetical protein
MKSVVKDGFVEDQDRQTSKKGKIGESRWRKVMGLRFLKRNDGSQTTELR